MRQLQNFAYSPDDSSEDEVVGSSLELLYSNSLTSLSLDCSTVAFKHRLEEPISCAHVVFQVIVLLSQQPKGHDYREALVKCINSKTLDILLKQWIHRQRNIQERFH